LGEVGAIRLLILAFSSLEEEKERRLGGRDGAIGTRWAKGFAVGWNALAGRRRFWVAGCPWAMPTARLAKAFSLEKCGCLKRMGVMMGRKWLREGIFNWLR